MQHLLHSAYAGHEDVDVGVSFSIYFAEVPTIEYAYAYAYAHAHERGLAPPIRTVGLR